MTNYSKFNIIYRLQKWLDSVPGQTFMNYAYSWGASIVILGTLFKLTHLPGANLMLFIGMGTEVFVFFIAAFDRPFDKTADGMDLPMHVGDDNLEADAVAAGEPGVVGVSGISATSGISGVAGGSGTIIIGGGSAEGVSGEGNAAFTEGAGGEVTGGGVVGGGIIGGGVIGGVVTPQPELPEIDAEEMEEATTGYVEQLKKLTETLQKVAEQSERLTRDSEEMENLNRTLTGISRVYEMQLKGASQQIGTIDQINEQTRRLADQIAETNKIHTLMIEAMTVNMPKSPMNP